MSRPDANIRIPVDLTNPGQFFACCGLLELADRLWPGAEGWFGPREFFVLTKDRAGSLSELMSQFRSMTFDVGNDADADDDEEKDDSSSVDPIQLESSILQFSLQLDWWTDKSIKPWAGSMKERVILRAMLDAIDPAHGDPLNDLKPVYYKPPSKKKAAKKEPFYFDPRRGNKSHPVDSGFSPDAHKMESECSPALEALCFVGLERARPAPTGVANQSRYTVWSRHRNLDFGLPALLVGPVVCGSVSWPTLGRFIFTNYFRTDQRKHKTFSQSTLDRSNHG